jgi:hypothetical protein
MEKTIYVYEDWSGDAPVLLGRLYIKPETAAFYDIAPSDAKAMAHDILSTVHDN